MPAGTRSLVVNIGSHIDPLLPPEDDLTVSTIAFEPVVHASIQRVERLHVVPAAVGTMDGLTTMHVYNHGASSSLSRAKDSVLQKLRHVEKFNSAAVKASGAGLPAALLVPLISFRRVLDELPSELPVWLLKTDMQGHDFRTVSSVGELLRRRVHYVHCEVYNNGSRARYYEDTPSNEFCTDWVPHMEALGYELYVPDRRNTLAARCRGKRVAREFDARWKLRGTMLPSPWHLTTALSNRTK